MSLRVAACQLLTKTDLKENTNRIVHWIKKAAEDNVDIVSFPEACLCSYTADPQFWEKADPDAFLAAEQKVIEASKKYGIAVVLGNAHWEDDELRNGILVIDKGGIVKGRYSKTHLAEKWPQPGKQLPIYFLCGIPCCFIICHDVRYPEVVRLPAIAGAQICWFCSNESGLTSEWKLSAYRAMPISRATENTIFVVMSNSPADPEDVDGNGQSHGNSKIIHPDGNVLKEAGFFEEGLVAADIKIEDANRSMALRASTDETILKDWMNEGVKMVKIEEG